MKVLIVEPDKLPYLKDIRQDLSTYREIVGGSIPVSYTHLDVYKRQVLQYFELCSYGSHLREIFKMDTNL